jgi:hypothetical protein
MSFIYTVTVILIFIRFIIRDVLIVYAQPKKLQMWTLKVGKNYQARLLMREKPGVPWMIKDHISWISFPAENWPFLIKDRVLMLPSEKK